MIKLLGTLLLLALSWASILAPSNAFAAQQVLITAEHPSTRADGSPLLRAEIQGYELQYRLDNGEWGESVPIPNTGEDSISYTLDLDLQHSVAVRQFGFRMLTVDVYGLKSVWTEEQITRIKVLPAAPPEPPAQQSIRIICQGCVIEAAP